MYICMYNMLATPVATNSLNRIHELPDVLPPREMRHRRQPSNLKYIYIYIYMYTYIHTCIHTYIHT